MKEEELGVKLVLMLTWTRSQAHFRRAPALHTIIRSCNKSGALRNRATR